MVGDEQVRHCLSCKMNVYNLSDMSDREIYKLVREKEGRLCIKILKRPDGTLVTDNCPRALRAFRNRMRLVAASVIALFVTVGLIQAAHAQGLVGAPISTRFGGYGGGEQLPEQNPAWVYIAFVSMFSGVSILLTVTSVYSKKWNNWDFWGKFVVLFLATAIPTVMLLIFAAEHNQSLF